jgi:hypothetical protein
MPAEDQFEIASYRGAIERVNNNPIFARDVRTAATIRAGRRATPRKPGRTMKTLYQYFRSMPGT